MGLFRRHIGVRRLLRSKIVTVAPVHEHSIKKLINK